MVYEKRSGHIGGSFSLAEIIAYLYSNFDLTSDKKYSPKLILSKGHAVPILYAVLFELGLITNEEISLFREINSPLQGHPDKNKLKFMHATTGSLGQGLSIAIGHALGLKKISSSSPCFCIVGDGEIQEGQIWESAMTAPMFKMDNLIAFTDFNKMQIDGETADIMNIEKLDAKWEAFGWHTQRIDGHDFNAIDEAVQAAKAAKGKPSMIILDTIKGKGCPAAEGKVSSHNMPVSQEQLDEALTALGYTEGEF